VITETIRSCCDSEGVDIEGGSGKGVLVAADVHYLAVGDVWAAAVVSTDAAFSHVVADRVELMPEVEPDRPGRFYLRELPPLHAPGCPAPTPSMPSGIWQASTGCPTPSAAPTLSPAPAHRGTAPRLAADRPGQ
jgi:hypothetical protein